MSLFIVVILSLPRRVPGLGVRATEITNEEKRNWCAGTLEREEEGGNA
jgi:hypothetical protein